MHLGTVSARMQTATSLGEELQKQSPEHELLRFFWKRGATIEERHALFQEFVKCFADPEVTTEMEKMSIKGMECVWSNYIAALENALEETAELPI
jgi:hypothetical protein